MAGAFNQNRGFISEWFEFGDVESIIFGASKDLVGLVSLNLKDQFDSVRRKKPGKRRVDERNCEPSFSIS